MLLKKARDFFTPAFRSKKKQYFTWWISVDGRWQKQFQNSPSDREFWSTLLEKQVKVIPWIEVEQIVQMEPEFMMRIEAQVLRKKSGRSPLPLNDPTSQVLFSFHKRENFVNFQKLNPWIFTFLHNGFENLVFYLFPCVIRRRNPQAISQQKLLLPPKLRVSKIKKEWGRRSGPVEGNAAWWGFSGWEFSRIAGYARPRCLTNRIDLQY